MSLAGRVALVTGGNRGIGRAISMALAEDGAAVAINYRRGEDEAVVTRDAIEAAGGKARIYQASVDSLEDDTRMVEAALVDFGHVDILVLNAGIASRGQSVQHTEPAEFERVMRTHAFGAFYLCKLLAPQMRALPRGDIVMISSAVVKNPAAKGGPYQMAKAALEALALTMAQEERRHNTRVNIVRPGLTETEMGRRLMKAVSGVDSLRELDATQPFGRVCQPEDIANVVRWVVSDRCSYITGECIQVDGGGNLLSY